MKRGRTSARARIIATAMAIAWTAAGGSARADAADTPSSTARAAAHTHSNTPRNAVHTRSSTTRDDAHAHSHPPRDDASAGGGAESRRATELRVDDLVLRAQGMDLAHSKQWLRLGYWRDSLLGGLSSEIDGPFFLARDGATNPEAELDATVRAFFAPASGDGHARCRYPARFRFLRRALGISPDEIPQKECPRYRAWVRNLQATSATLVFSSYYLNNAASAFGHTFLRLGRDEKLTGGERKPLLDTGINYAATVTTQNVLLYAFYGLAGLFKGQFTALPYFYKVREYNDYESRDLWEYELNLTEDQLAMLAAHLWELASTYFQYWYLSENCSYHILTTIEVARPDLDLVGQLHWPVVPADTVKAVARAPGLVKRVVFRPSARSQLRARTAHMTGEERALVAQLAHDPHTAIPATMSVRTQVEILDAAADLIDLRYAHDLARESDDTEGGRLKQMLLSRRAALGVTSEPLVVETPWPKLPDRSHDSRRVAFGGGYGSERGGFGALRMRLAMHDFADPTTGFPDTTRLEFLPTTLRFWVPEGRVALESAYLVRVASLSPVSSFNHSLSWKLDAGVRRVWDDGCDHCLAGHGEVGVGFTASAGTRNRVMLYLMQDTLVGWGPSVDGVRSTGWRAGLGASAGLRIRWTPAFLTLVTGAWHWLPDQPSLAEWRGEGTARLELHDNLALDLESSLDNRELETRTSLMVYF